MAPFWTKQKKIIFGLLILAAFASQTLPRLWNDSLVNDEPWEITQGYYFWIQNPTTSNLYQVPLSNALSGLPLFFLKLKTDLPATGPEERGYEFFYHLNASQLQAMTVLARSVNWLFALGIGLFLFAICQKDKDPIWVWVLLLWVFEPTLLAMANFSKTDIPFTFFYLVSVVFFQKTLRNPTQSRYFFTGVLSAMAITTKSTGLILLPLFFILELAQTPSLAQIFEGKRLGRWRWLLSGIICFTLVFYFPVAIRAPHFFNNSWKLFQQWVYENYLNFFPSGHPYFFMGQCSLQKHWLYFPTVFVLKSTIPFLLLLLIAIPLVLSRKIQLALWEWASPLLFFIAILPIPNLGARYFLPIFPFLIIIAAKAAHWMWEEGAKASRKWIRLIVLGLIFSNATSVWLSYPRYVSYFNELTPSDRKIEELGDWNLDVSQDQKRLALFAQKKGWQHIKLAYLGGTDPHFYGLIWNRWTKKDLRGPQRGWVYLINAGFLQEAPVFFPSTLPIARSWISHLKSDHRFGDIWYYTQGPLGSILPDNSPPLDSVPVLDYQWNQKTGQPIPLTHPLRPSPAGGENIGKNSI